QGTDGQLYGATCFGGNSGNSGVLFRVTYTGAFSILHNIASSAVCPQVPLFQHTDGTFFSDAYEGGTHSEGALYSLKVGLHPFVALVTTSGKVGQTVEILGNGLTGATSVKFGTGSASFKVVSDTYMTAVVPAAGTTGALTVATPSGFRV